MVLEVPASLAIVALTDDVRALAAQMEPVELRTLDAVHLASALTLGDDLGAVLTYDRRMAAAAGELDVIVLSPA
ncbi:MAG: PIN domain-containing protein [Solirubrobacteraceae bacterium]